MASQDDPEAERDFEGVLDDTNGYVDATVGIMEMVLPNGYAILEEDYRVKGEVWRVHKGDADPIRPNRTPIVLEVRNGSWA